MQENYVLEVCIDSIHSALAAQEGGAARVELCDNLFDGGTTPSAGLIEVVRENIKIGLQVMIRPRGGDFLYSDLEFEIMKKDIEMAKKLRADGVVFGILKADGTIDKKRTDELVRLARPLNVTFHRAFDMTSDPMKAIEDLMDLNIDRLLTSGLEATAYEGAELISELVRKSGDKIIIMPGSGITDRNISKIRKITGAKEFHVSGRSAIASKMQYVKSNVFMGGTLRPDEYKNSFTDERKIKNIKSNLIM